MVAKELKRKYFQWLLLRFELCCGQSLFLIFGLFLSLPDDHITEQSQILSPLA